MANQLATTVQNHGEGHSATRFGERSLYEVNPSACPSRKDYCLKAFIKETQENRCTVCLSPIPPPPPKFPPPHSPIFTILTHHWALYMLLSSLRYPPVLILDAQVHRSSFPTCRVLLGSRHLDHADGIIQR